MSSVISSQQLTLPLMVISVKIGPKRTETVKLYKDSNVEKVADNFVKKHGLSPSLRVLLGQEILLSMERVLREELSNLRVEEAPAKQESPSPQFSKIKTEATLKESSVSNLGTKIYDKGLLHKEKQEVSTKRLREKLETEENKKLTFKPHISRMSRLLASKTQSDFQRNLRSPLREQMSREASMCTFSPSINLNSQKLVKSNGNKFLELYHESFSRKERREGMEKNFYKNAFSFHPNPSTRPASPWDIVERLTKKKPCPEIKLSDSVDETTGQRLFVPKIGRGPKTSRNLLKLPVGDYLYTQKKASPLRETEQHEEVIINTRSEKLLLNIKIQRYFEVFQALCTDVDGYLTGNDMNIEGLDKDAKRILKPLLDEITSYEKPLNFEDFVEAMENLVSTLTPGEKSVFYRRKKEQFEEVPTQTTGSFNGSNMYERHVKKVKEVEEKTQKQKERLIREEVSACTFRPVITHYR